MRLYNWDFEPHWQAEWQNMAYGFVLYATRQKVLEWEKDRGVSYNTKGLAT